MRKNLTILLLVVISLAFTAVSIAGPPPILAQPENSEDHPWGGEDEPTEPTDGVPFWIPVSTGIIIFSTYVI